MLSKISNIIISISLIGLIILLIYSYNIKLKNEEIINQIKQNNDSVKRYYVGYIDICDKQIPLVYGTSSKELNQNVVGISKHSNNNLILAGHAIKEVFMCLYDIPINSTITIYLNDIKTTYKVDQKLKVNRTDTSIYQNNDLILITCIDKNTRLIVHAKTA